MPTKSYSRSFSILGLDNIARHKLRLTIEVQNLLYLSASPPLLHSGAGHELLNTKSGATGLALSSLGFGKKRPQRNATLKGKSTLQIQKNIVINKHQDHFVWNLNLIWTMLTSCPVWRPCGHLLGPPLISCWEAEPGFLGQWWQWPLEPGR